MIQKMNIMKRATLLLVLFCLAAFSLLFWTKSCSIEATCQCKQNLAALSTSSPRPGVVLLLEEVSYQIPPIMFEKKVELPSFKMMLGDLMGNCNFLTNGPEDYCELMANGFESGVHRHVFDPFILSLRGHKGGNVVDLGSNVGLFCTSAAAMRFNVICVEAQLGLNRLARATAFVNGFEERMQIRDGMIVAQKNVMIKHIPDSLYIPGDAEIRQSRKQARTATNMIEIDEVVQGDTILIKIDIDGPEGALIKGLFPLLKKYYVENLVIEMGADSWSKYGTTQKEALDLYVKLSSELGYCMYYHPYGDQVQRHSDLLVELKRLDDLESPDFARRLRGYYFVPKEKAAEVLMWNGGETKNIYYSKIFCLAK